MSERPADGIGEQPWRLAPEFPHVPCCQQAHVEQEERQHPFEKVTRKRLHRRSARLAGHDADGHRPQQQELGAIGKRLVQDPSDGHAMHGVIGRCRNTAGCFPCIGHLALPHQVGKQNRHDDRGRFHQGHGRRHVSAVRQASAVEVLRGRDEGDCADRSIGGRDGGRIKAVQEPSQQAIPHCRHDDSESDRAGEADGHLAGETRLGKGETALEPERHQEVESEEARDLRWNLQVGLESPGEDAKNEEQDCRIKDALHGSRRRKGATVYVFVSPPCGCPTVTRCGIGSITV